MKTQNYIRQYFPVLTICLVLIASTIDAGADNNRNEKRSNGKHRTEYKKSNNNYKKDGKSWKNEKSWNENDRYSEYYPKYNRKYSGNREYYAHPRYGRVYERFDHSPVVFRHERNNYYYYGNHFYTYRHGVGYCVVEAPRNVYFSRLPMECNRVHINGQVLFRNGDLYFQLSPRGYALVPAPVGIRISANF